MECTVFRENTTVAFSTKSDIYQEPDQKSRENVTGTMLWDQFI